MPHTMLLPRSALEALVNPAGHLADLRRAFAIGELQSHPELHLRIPVISVGVSRFQNGFLRLRKHFAVPRLIHAQQHRLFWGEHKECFVAGHKNRVTTPADCFRRAVDGEVGRKTNGRVRLNAPATTPR